MSVYCICGTRTTSDNLGTHQAACNRTMRARRLLGPAMLEKLQRAREERRLFEEQWLANLTFRPLEGA